MGLAPARGLILWHSVSLPSLRMWKIQIQSVSQSDPQVMPEAAVWGGCSHTGPEQQHWTQGALSSCDSKDVHLPEILLPWTVSVREEFDHKIKIN